MSARCRGWPSGRPEPSPGPLASLPHQVLEPGWEKGALGHLLDGYPITRPVAEVPAARGRARTVRAPGRAVLPGQGDDRKFKWLHKLTELDLIQASLSLF